MDLRTAFIVSALCCLACGSVVPRVETPEYLKLCTRYDPKIDECLKKRFQDLVPHLLTGEPETGLPSLRDVRLSDTDFRREIAADVEAGLSLGLSFLHDLEYVQVKSVKSDITDSKVKMNVDLVFPKLHLEGYFRTNLGLNKMTFINEGTFNLSLVDVATTLAVSAKTYEKNGLKYLQVQHVRTRPDIGGAQLSARNQGDGYSTVVKVGAAIINKYWDALYSEYVPYLEEKWDVTLTDVVNKVLSRVPYDHLFPRA
ncbi:circadian clock-controlled protein daywake-like [Bacillus rossius redtenbacheri]|uniref:circadian clock-controlled protein daywake-like n=1 Tax=Bacillus rossius redtenbacheri TaxID=93214 RepID=UPI002FDECCFF